MRFAVSHRTCYTYSGTAVSTVQALRLTPRREPQQRIGRWQVRGPATLTESVDSFGNIMHLMSVHRPHGEIVLEARGELDVDELIDGRLRDPGGVPPLVYAQATTLTRADERIARLAAPFHGRLRGASDFLDLALAVRQAIDYTPGTTDARTTATEAIALGRGVCQDQAHVYLAACRSLGQPARYVSGYHYGEGAAADTASHAWVDAWVDEGWVSIDVTHGGYANDRLCRLAVGRDYDTAGPVRGVRVGGGAETLDVRVTITPGTAPREADAAR